MEPLEGRHRGRHGRPRTPGPAVSVGREVVCRLRRACYGARTTEAAPFLRVLTTSYSYLADAQRQVLRREGGADARETPKGSFPAAYRTV